MDVDNLSLKISAEAQSALTALDRLSSKLKTVASDISAIGKKSININFTISGGSEQKINRLEQYVESASKKMSAQLSDAFNLDKSATKNIEELSQNLAESFAKTGEIDRSGITELYNELQRTGSQCKYVDDYLQEIYQTIKGYEKIKISSPIDADDWKNQYGGLIGVFNKSEGTEIDEVFERLKGDFEGVFAEGSELDKNFKLDNALGQFNALNEIARKANEAVKQPFENLGDVVTEANPSVSEMINSIKEAKSVLEETGGIEDTKNEGFTELANGLKKIGNIDAGNLANIGSAISGFAQGVQSINDIKIDADSLSQMANVIKQIEKSTKDVSGEKFASVGNAISSIADGVRNLSGITFEDSGLKNVINSLTRLSNSNINTIDFSTLGNSLASFANSLSGAEKIQTSVVSIVNATARLAAAGDKIPTVTAELDNLGVKLRKFISDMSSAAAVESSTISFTQAIAQLANAGNRAEITASNLDNIAARLKAFMQTMSTAPNVSTSVIQMTSALASLASQGGKVSTATNTLGKSFSGAQTYSDSLSGSLKNLSSSISKMSTPLKNVGNKFKSFTRSIMSALGIVGGIYTIVRGIKESIDISSDITEVQNIVTNTFGQYSDKVEELANSSIQDFGMSELTTKKVSSRFQAMGVAMGFPTEQMADMSVNLTKLTADMASFYNVSQEDVAEDLNSVFTGQTRPLMLAA